MARTYDPAEVNLVIAGVVITGVAEDSWITAERDEDAFTPYVGAKGEVALGESNNRTGTLSVKLDGTSPSCNFLYSLANRKGENAIVPLSIIDANDKGKIHISADECRVKRPASYEAGKDIKEREFEIFAADLDFRV